MTTEFETLCLGCIEDKGHTMKCPLCGYDNAAVQEASSISLKPATVLHGKYLLGRVLGIGGFGITYIGLDINLRVKLAIKEYYPRHIAARVPGETTVKPHDDKTDDEFKNGLKAFLKEARAAAQFEHHPNIVTVKDYFENNGTAYMVMSYIDGKPFNKYLEENGGRVDYKKAFGVMFPIMDALEKIHSKGLLHRDISPENIYITRSGNPMLLDFGAARYTFGSQTQSMSLMLKEGYAPLEQYSKNGDQGAWTDIYAASATIYRAITGLVPPAALERFPDDRLVPPSLKGAVLPNYIEKVILKALSPRISDRYQNIADFKSELTEKEEEAKISFIVKQKKNLLILSVVVITIIFGIVIISFTKESESEERMAVADISKKLEHLEEKNAEKPVEKKPARQVSAITSQARKTVEKQPEARIITNQKPASQKLKGGYSLKEEQPVENIEPKKEALVEFKRKIVVEKLSPEELYKKGFEYEKIKNIPAAKEYYMEACEKDYSAACYQVGKIDNSGKSLEKARELFKKDCDSGRGASCLNLGTMLGRGEGGPKDAMKSMEILEKSCSLGQVYGCYTLADSLNKGNGIPENKALAREFFKKTCELKMKEGCFSYAEMLENGKGGVVNKPEGLIYFEKACKLGMRNACMKK